MNYLLQDITDIDKTLDEFVINFKRQYLLNFPETLATDVDGNKVNEANTSKKTLETFMELKDLKKHISFVQSIV